MIDKKISIRYARALLALSLDKLLNLNDILDELKVFQSILSKNEGVKEFLSSTFVSQDKKDKILKKLLKNVSEYTAKMIEYIIYRNRLHILDDMINTFEIMVNKNLGKTKGEIISAENLTKKEKKNIKSVFDNKLHKHIDFSYTIDKKLIAGIIVNIDDVVYDGSVKSYIAKLDLELSKLVIR